MKKNYRFQNIPRSRIATFDMTILVDHDVIDGAPMVRFLDDLTKYIESGYDIDTANY